MTSDGTYGSPVACALPEALPMARTPMINRNPNLLMLSSGGEVKGFRPLLPLHHILLDFGL
jgi:hypothetical protein